MTTSKSERFFCWPRGSFHPLLLVSARAQARYEPPRARRRSHACYLTEPAHQGAQGLGREFLPCLRRRLPKTIPVICHAALWWWNWCWPQAVACSAPAVTTPSGSSEFGHVCAGRVAGQRPYAIAPERPFPTTATFAFSGHSPR